MRYHFNIVTEKGVLKDLDGEEFPHIYAAMLEAEQTARALMATELAAGRKLLPDWGIQIANGRGVVFDQVTFGELLHRDGAPTPAQMAARASEIITRTRASVEGARASVHESQKLGREVRDGLDKTHAELRTLFRLAARLAKLTN
jgi:hypothetical protein